MTPQPKMPCTTRKHVTRVELDLQNSVNLFNEINQEHIFQLFGRKKPEEKNHEQFLEKLKNKKIKL